MNCPICNSKTYIKHSRVRKSNNVSRTRECSNCDVRIRTKEIINYVDIPETYKQKIIMDQDERRNMNGQS